MQTSNSRLGTLILQTLQVLFHVKLFYRIILESSYGNIPVWSGARGDITITAL